MPNVDLIIYCVPRFHDGDIGLLKPFPQDWALPHGYLLRREGFDDCARRVLQFHADAKLSDDPRSLDVIARMHSLHHELIVNELHGLVYICKEPSAKDVPTGWSGTKLVKMPTSSLPHPKDCPEYVQRALVEYFHYSTNGTIDMFTKWPEAWRVLATR
jgi:hypothetical protein